MNPILTIDPEFEAKCPPLTEDELAQLEENILERQCRSANSLQGVLRHDGSGGGAAVCHAGRRFRGPDPQRQATCKSSRRG